MSSSMIGCVGLGQVGLQITTGFYVSITDSLFLGDRGIHVTGYGDELHLDNLQALGDTVGVEIEAGDHVYVNGVFAVGGGRGLLVEDAAARVVVQSGSYFGSSYGAEVTAGELTMQGSLIESGDVGIRLAGNQALVQGTRIDCDQEAVIADGDENKVLDNILRGGEGLDNTYDSVVLNGDRNEARGNSILPSASGNLPRYCVTNAGDCNVFVGNIVRDFGTNPINDTGTNFQVFWPNDATWGDNFTDCEIPS